MAWFKATGSIRHNGKRYKAGVVVELDAKEKKSDLFVACDAPAVAQAAPVKAKKADEPAKEPEKAPKAEKKTEEKPGWFAKGDASTK